MPPHLQYTLQGGLGTRLTHTHYGTLYQQRGFGNETRSHATVHLLSREAWERDSLTCYSTLAQQGSLGTRLAHMLQYTCSAGKLGNETRSHATVHLLSREAWERDSLTCYSTLAQQGSLGTRLAHMLHYTCSAGKLGNETRSINGEPWKQDLLV